jgi:hypothetical protein
MKRLCFLLLLLPALAACQWMTEDYDEDKLNELLGLVNLRKPMQRILYILHDDLYLSEGFLPIGMTNDSKVQETRKLITLCKI